MSQHTYTDVVAVQAALGIKEIEMHLTWIDNVIQTEAEHLVTDCSDFLATVAEKQGGE